jgi:uncharacterized protein
MKAIVLFFSLLLISCFSRATGVPERPKPISYVNDFSGLLTKQEKKDLENMLKEYYDTTSTEIIILIQNSIQNDDIIEHGEHVIKEWGIGGINNDNGVIIAYAVEDNHMGVAVGKGINNFIDDPHRYRIRENLLKPSFREEKYYQGFYNASHAIMNLISGHYEIHDVKSESKNAVISIVVILSVFFIFFILLPAWRYRAVTRSHMGGHLDPVSVFLLMNNLGSSRGRTFTDFTQGKGNFRHKLQISGHMGGGGSSGQW